MRKIPILDRIGLALPKSSLAIIIWRELIDAIRDRRTILATVILPMILIPVMLNLPLFFLSPKQNPPNVGVIQLDPNASGFMSLLNGTGNMKVSKILTTESLTNLILRGVYDVAVIVPANFTSLIIGNETALLSVIYDSTNQRSSMGLALIQAVQVQYSNAVVKNRLSQLHIDPSLLNPVKLESVSVRVVTPSQAIAGYLIPYFISILSVAAGASFATDTTAGEKERRTLEVFLTQPVSRMKILLGKYLEISLLSLIGISFQIVGFVLGFNIYTSLYTEIIGQTSSGMNLSILNMFTIAGFALIISMTGNALLMAVSIFAKSFKEAQQYTSAFTIVLVIPMLIVMYLPPAVLSHLVFLPLLGPVIMIRNAVFDILAFDQFLICLDSSVIYLLVLIYAAFKVFSREKVIFRV